MQIYNFSSKQQRNEEKKGLVIALGKVTTHLPIQIFQERICSANLRLAPI